MIKTKIPKLKKGKEKASKPNKYFPHVPHTHSALLWPSKGRTFHCHVVDGGGGKKQKHFNFQILVSKKFLLQAMLFYSALSESKMMNRTESTALVASCVVSKREIHYCMKTYGASATLKYTAIQMGNL